MANCLYLHDSYYITNFDFMNYAFAKLVISVIQINKFFNIKLLTFSYASILAF